MASSTPAAPAAETTRLEVSLCRSGQIEHHDFVFELPKGMDPKEFLEELEESRLEMDEVGIRWDCLEHDNPHIEAFKN